MKKLLKIKTLAICAILMAGMVIPFTMTAQRNDGFFRGGYDNINDRDDITIGGAASTTNGLTIEGMDNEDPTQAPLGSGLLIMVAAGAGYAIMHRKRSRRGTPRVSNVMMVLMALVLMLGMTQCKKRITEPTVSQTILVSLDASFGDSKTVFIPGDDQSGFHWSGTEYAYVSGSTSGYLGRLSADAPVPSTSTEIRIVFNGTITKPTDNENLYFFYLGNGARTIADVSTETIDFSNQVDLDAGTVTNYLLAVSGEEAKLTLVGDHYEAYADMKVKTAIAYFSLDGFENASHEDETIYLHGAEVYSSAVVDFKAGTIHGQDKGYINLGTDGPKFVSLIPSTDAQTTLKFDSNSQTSSLEFQNGIKAKKFYSAGVENNTASPLPVTVTSSLPDDVLPGLFSVAPGKMVRFSKGNLKCTTNAIPDANGHYDWSSASYTWSFMEPQYKVIEQNDVDWQIYEYILEFYPGDDYSWKTEVSLFGWGTTGASDLTQTYKYPYNTAYDTGTGYGPKCSLSVEDHTDWGWCMGGEQSPWRTLTSAEWTWLIGNEDSDYLPSGTTPDAGVNCRTASTISGKSDARFVRAEIEVDNDHIKGMILFPDEFVLPTGITLTTDNINYQPSSDAGQSSWGHYDVISSADWSKMEDAGAVFLPFSGYRFDCQIDEVQLLGFYWSSSYGSGSNSRALQLNGGRLLMSTRAFLGGYSVRLVTDGD